MISKADSGSQVATSLLVKLFLVVATTHAFHLALYLLRIPNSPEGIRPSSSKAVSVLDEFQPKSGRYQSDSLFLVRVHRRRSSAHLSFGMRRVNRALPGARNLRSRKTAARAMAQPQQLETAEAKAACNG